MKRSLWIPTLPKSKLCPLLLYIKSHGNGEHKK